MKKTIFLGIAALLALALFSCGDDISLPKEDVGSADGITLVGPEFSASRALVGATSEAGTNYYEATFQKMREDPGNTGDYIPVTPAKIARAKWGYARKGRIQLEPGFYNVVLMAGRSSDATLLGVGKVKTITDTDAITNVATNTDIAATTLLVEIKPTTTDLTYVVYALMNDIKAAAGSTFVTTPAQASTGQPTTIDELGNRVPVFVITKDDTTTAEWSFGLGNFPGGTSSGGITVDDQITLLGPEIKLKGTPALYEVGFSYTDTYDVPQKLVAKSITANNLSDGIIDISVTAPDDDGMLQLALEVPVCSIATTDDPMTWFIRGGLNNGAIDAGRTPTYAKPGQIGGAVVLGFGNLSNFPKINLIPDHPFIVP